MKIRMCWSLLLLLAACVEPYDYSLTWTCISPEGCERADDVKRIDRFAIERDALFFQSTHDSLFLQRAQRFSTDSSPDGCAGIYALSLFGHELESAMICETSYGFEMTLAIPNLDPVTRSEWLVEVRAL
jgi:hypothetical protein